ncbi:Polygalacturonase QRT3 [Linum grandiflorum]
MNHHHHQYRSSTILYLILLAGLLQHSSSYTTNNKLSEFQEKLQRKTSNSSLGSTAWNSSSSTLHLKRVSHRGKVFYPIGYGADPSGSIDSSDAILRAINDAFRLQKHHRRQLLPGIQDLGGIVLDLQGGNFLISKPIQLPSGRGNFVVRSGTFRATNDFPGNRHLIELWSTNSQQKPGKGSYYEGITFRDILFDSTYRGGGIRVVDSVRIRIDHCFFLHFTTQAVGVVLRSEANTVTAVHCYNKANVYGGVGIVVKPEASLTRITGCYMDFTDVVIEDPDQVRVSDGLFIGGANVVVKSIRGSISGLNVEGNMFRGYEGRGNSIVELDGNFTAVDQVVVDRNNVKDMVLKSTAGKVTVAGYGSRWVADFSRVLIFPDRISHFQYAFHVRGGGGGENVTHWVSGVSGNAVVVQSNAVVNAVVSVVVDQYNVVDGN